MADSILNFISGNYKKFLMYSKLKDTKEINYNEATIALSIFLVQRYKCDNINLCFNENNSQIWLYVNDVLIDLKERW